MISVERILELHTIAIEKWGGSPGQHEKRSGCLDGSIGAARSRCSYQYTEDDFLQWAAGLLYYLAKNHCMDDGNKRIAWMSAEDVLRSGGLRIDATEADAEDLVLRLAGGIGDADEVADWIAERICSL